jgi:hypothetical protein
MSDAIELTADEFTAERFKPLFEEIFQEGDLPFDATYFFPSWQCAMRAGLARVWTVDHSSALGAYFVRDMFSGLVRATVPFWFAMREVRNTGAAGKVMRAFEAAARAAGAVDIQTAAHDKFYPSRRAYSHRQHGYQQTETIYTKTL